jgi:hypothetical protein
MTQQITIEKINEPEVKQLAKVIMSALKEYRKYLPKQQIQVEIWIMRKICISGIPHDSIRFTYLDNKVKDSSHFEPCENHGVRQLSFSYHDLMVTIEKRSGERIELIFRIHDLRTIEYFTPNTFFVEWIYYGKIELRDYYIYA